jgi:hypothetical protein
MGRRFGPGAKQRRRRCDRFGQQILLAQPASKLCVCKPRGSSCEPKSGFKTEIPAHYHRAYSSLFLLPARPLWRKWASWPARARRAQRAHTRLTVFDLLPRIVLVHRDNLAAIPATVLHFHRKLPPNSETLFPGYPPKRSMDGGSEIGEIGPASATVTRLLSRA